MYININVLREVYDYLLSRSKYITKACNDLENNISDVETYDE